MPITAYEPTLLHDMRMHQLKCAENLIGESYRHRSTRSYKPLRTRGGDGYPETGCAVKERQRLAADAGGEGDLCDNTGGFIPFAATTAERLASGDPRLSLEERYGTHDGSVAAVRKAADALVAERLMLPEDVAGAVAIAQANKIRQ